jgi:hypothetical protein
MAGGVVGIYTEMEFVRMQTKKVAIEGRWFNLYFFKEDDGIRIEMEDVISGKRNKVFPDNKIKDG